MNAVFLILEIFRILKSKGDVNLINFDNLNATEDEISDIFCVYRHKKKNKIYHYKLTTFSQLLIEPNTVFDNLVKNIICHYE